MVIQTWRGTQLHQIELALPWVLLLQAPKSTFLHVEEGHWEQDSVISVYETLRLSAEAVPSHPTLPAAAMLHTQLRGSPCCANRWQTGSFLPSASWRYFCPTSLRYSSIALVASVFSLKIKTSCSAQRSTSAITKSVKKSWGKKAKWQRWF